MYFYFNAKVTYFFILTSITSDFGNILLPTLAVFYFRLWQRFTSGFGCVLLPTLAIICRQYFVRFPISTPQVIHKQQTIFYPFFLFFLQRQVI